MDPTSSVKRALLSIVIFFIVFFLSPYIIGWTAYDVYVRAIEFLAAILAAGCYWIGSSKR